MPLVPLLDPPMEIVADATWSHPLLLEDNSF